VNGGVQVEIKPTGSKIMNQPTELPGRTSGTSGIVRDLSFSEALQDSDSKRRHEVCANLLQQIDTQSEELKKGATPAAIKRYRKLVQTFMKEALGQSYSLNQESHWDRSGNRKIMVTVKRINQSLEELTDALLSKEKKQIDLVARLDEIRGLLIDLYV
jgi:uncharacterized protein YaaR (DUF327 family)